VDTTNSAAAPAAATARSRVEVRGLSKTFPGTRALSSVDLEIRAGEIHGLVGGNGSGKSTLIKILSGVYQGDRGGSVRVGEVETDADGTTPEFARAAGIHVVHQDLGVFTDMTVAENLALGHGYETGSPGRIRWRRQRARAKEVLERFEIDVPVRARLTQLSQVARTRIAIARALQDQDEGDEKGLLILDEPTAALPAHEVDLLLETLRSYASQGQSILYVSHRLEEILELTNRVTVLRDGVKSGPYETAELDEEALIKLIVGRQVDRVFPPMPKVENAAPLLQLRGVSAGPLRNVNLTVAEGEVVGIGGLLGSGRSELLRIIFGDLKMTEGEILLGSEPLRVKSPDAAIAAGIAYVPENRASDAAFTDLSVANNIAVASIREYFKSGHMTYRKMRRDSREAMADFKVKAASDGSLLATLSGGNQQKVMMARWLRRKPRLLLLDEPTHGVDVGARAEIYGLVRDAVADGAAALIVASDFEELAHVSDRVIVLGGGTVKAEVKPDNLSAESLMQAANKRKEG
jgi:ribose transport system ATP-binding protein